MAVHIFHRDDPSARLPIISKDARLVVWPGTGSRTANMNYVILEDGETNSPHAHAESEDTIFILRGHGTVHDVTNGVILDVHEGQVVHVPAGVIHAVRADKGVTIESVGGPSPPDRHLLEKLGLQTEP